MAPLLPVLIILLILFFLLTGGLIYLGVLGLRSTKSVKKFLGILSLLISFSLFIFMGLSGYSLLHHEDSIRDGFVGKYKAIVDENNTEEIEMTINASTYSISKNSYTDCQTGTWSPELMDDGYIVQFNCSEGRPLEQFRLKENELSSFNKLRFLRIKTYE